MTARLTLICHAARKPSHTTHLRDISSFVTILRERHPFEGRSLQVMGAIKRRGVLTADLCSVNHVTEVAREFIVRR